VALFAGAAQHVNFWPNQWHEFGRDNGRCEGRVWINLTIQFGAARAA